MNPNLSLDEFKENSGYQIGNFWYPRVTKIVEIKSKPALYRFYGTMASFADAERVKERSATEGTLVHNTIEDILLRKKPSIPPSIEPSIKSFLEFVMTRNIQVDPRYVEHRLSNHEYRYAGTLDAIATIDGTLGILDIKTSQEIYRDYNLQTSAYFYAMKDVVRGLKTRWILRIDQRRVCATCGALLRSKGGVDKVKTEWNNKAMKICNHTWGPLEGKIELKEFPYWESDFEAFLGAKRLWEWEHEEMLKKIGYLE